MELLQHIPLQPFNTFRINAKARFFCRFTNLEDLMEVWQEMRNQSGSAVILGGGSNVLLTTDINDWVLKNEIRGIEVVKEDETHYYIQAGAGENWHQFVLRCIENNYAGIENLSLIPGNVGASPMQNIGAYGVEIKDVFHELEAFDLFNGTVHRFSLEDCRFRYRESVFKKEFRDRYVITSVTFRLNKKPDFNTSYGAIREEMEKMNVKELSIRAISQAVINIRSSKLPDPAVLGNAGSFFKNPEVGLQVFENLRGTNPSLPGYPVGSEKIKLAAGWLIEQCGWKGYRKGDAGCYPKQALVLVNYGEATGEEILRLSEEIIHSVKEKFGVALEREVNIYGDLRGFKD